MIIERTDAENTYTIGLTDDYLKKVKDSLINRIPENTLPGLVNDKIAHIISDDVAKAFLDQYTTDHSNKNIVIYISGSTVIQQVSLIVLSTGVVYRPI